MTLGLKGWRLRLAGRPGFFCNPNSWTDRMEPSTDGTPRNFKSELSYSAPEGNYYADIRGSGLRVTVYRCGPYRPGAACRCIGAGLRRERPAAGVRKGNTPIRNGSTPMHRSTRENGDTPHLRSRVQRCIGVSGRSCFRNAVCGLSATIVSYNLIPCLGSSCPEAATNRLHTHLTIKYLCT